MTCSYTVNTSLVTPSPHQSLFNCKNDKSLKVRKHISTRCHEIREFWQFIEQINIIILSIFYFIGAGITLQLWYFTQSKPYLLSYSTQERCPVSRSSRNLSEFATPVSNLQSSKAPEFAVIRPRPPKPRLARNARKVRCPDGEPREIGGQLVLSEGPGSVSCLVIKRPGARRRVLPRRLRENNIKLGEKNARVRACNLHSLFDGKCSVYKY